MSYKLTHPNSKHEIEVDAAQVAIYESQGWETSPHARKPSDDNQSEDE
jgi:hypothetical protein